MLELVSQNYWWPGLSRYVTKFVAGCNTCNWTKTFPTQKVGKLIPNKVPDQGWQVISIDMIRELLDSKGYNAILVVVDHLSKRIHTIPTVTSLDSGCPTLPQPCLPSSQTPGGSNQQLWTHLCIQLLQQACSPPWS